MLRFTVNTVWEECGKENKDVQTSKSMGGLVVVVAGGKGSGSYVIYNEGLESWFAVTAFYACHWQIDILKMHSWLPFFHVSVFVQAISGLMKGISIKDEILSLLYWNAQGGSRGRMEQWKLYGEFFRHLADTGQDSLGMPGAVYCVAGFTAPLQRSSVHPP